MASIKINNLQLIATIFIAVLVVAVIDIYAFTFVIPNSAVNKEKRYTEAAALLETGKYAEGKNLLDKLRGFNDVDTIQEQIKHESIACNCIKELKDYLNPDSLTLHEINFYLEAGAKEGSFPVCVMYVSGQNVLGDNSTIYAAFTNYDKDKKYLLYATTHTLNLEDLDRESDDYDNNLNAVEFIKRLAETGKEVGSVNIDRLGTVIRNGAYSAVKIIT